MVTCQQNLGSVGIQFFLPLAKPEIVVFGIRFDSGISFSKFPVSRHLLKLFYDENTQFSYLLCSQFRQKASGWINKTLLLIKQHVTYMNISRYANIDKFVNIRYIFLLARRTYSWLFQLAQMWKLLAPGVGLGDLLTPVVLLLAGKFWAYLAGQFSMRKLNIVCLPGKSNLDFYQGALPVVYVYLHYLDTRHQSRVVIHNEVKIICRRTPLT